MGFKRGNGIQKLKSDLNQGRKAGLEALKSGLENRVDDPGESRPGEYPAKDTGELAGSFFVTEEGVINTAPHAVYLEFKHPSEGGRPFMSAAARDEVLGAEVALAVAERIKRG